ncbi:MAG: glucokinase [Thermoanaerobaculia bacterium]
MILAGDVGGTKTLLALFEREKAGLRQVRERTYASREHASLAAIVADFLAGTSGPAPEAACFGVAGPVRDGRVRATNLPWEIDAGSLAAELGIARVVLLNDLEAAARGILLLTPGQFAILQQGDPDSGGNAAVIAPGTGLGVALLVREGNRFRAVASEGGHADFAPRDEREIALLRYLQVRYGGHVSCERILSGDGIHALYCFERDRGTALEPDWLRERLASGDPNATISDVALAGGHPLCVAALELFCSILGAEAGNLALRAVATGGIYVGGGIAPQIVSALADGTFVRAFGEKGRFSDWMRSIPVRVALEPRAPLLGAARALLEGGEG